MGKMDTVNLKGGGELKNCLQGTKVIIVGKGLPVFARAILLFKKASGLFCN